MAPIHDTDIAEDRWARAEWERYELWEKIEIKLRRRRFLWISGAILCFLGISSIPIWLDRAPRWTAVSMVRRLADQINHVKRDSAVAHQAFRLRFAGDGSLAYFVEESNSCDPRGVWKRVREGSLDSSHEGIAKNYVLLSPTQGSSLGIPGLIDNLCYDPVTGSDLETRGSGLAGFGILTANDLLEKRLDRTAILLVTGSTAEPTFE